VQDSMELADSSPLRLAQNDKGADWLRRILMRTITKIKGTEN